MSPSAVPNLRNARRPQVSASLRHTVHVPAPACPSRAALSRFSTPSCTLRSPLARAPRRPAPNSSPHAPVFDARAQLTNSTPPTLDTNPHPTLAPPRRPLRSMHASASAPCLCACGPSSWHSTCPNTARPIPLSPHLSGRTARPAPLSQHLSARNAPPAPHHLIISSSRLSARRLAARRRATAARLGRAVRTHRKPAGCGRARAKYHAAAAAEGGRRCRGGLTKPDTNTRGGPPMRAASGAVAAAHALRE